MNLFCKACRNESFTNEERSSGNLDRKNMIPLLDDDEDTILEIAHQIVQPPAADEPAPQSPPPPPSSWANFTISAPALAATKSLATTTLPPICAYISTDDALSAFIWQSLARVRQRRLPPTTEVTFDRVVNARRYLGIPESYPGFISNMVYYSQSLDHVVQEPLGVIAATLRSAVDAETSSVGHGTRALATFMDMTEDKSLVSLSATLVLTSDFMLSSWTNLNSYNLDFELGLGLPEEVRRPRFTPHESLGYLLPKGRDGRWFWRCA
ncbi:MAG: hypothetical protein Q9222_004349 [Ikaeria aurantiellina]